MTENSILRLPAPAKLNLMLRIVGRRADGYHLLQTVFQFIDRCDWITFRPRADGVVRLTTPLPGVPEDQDLTVRAALALQAFANISEGVDIAVEKNLPMGGGLGGGSSDAATTLVGLNRLWGAGLSSSDLQALGLRLGADVPVFVNGQSAWAEGVGEVLTPIDPPERWYVVLVPPCHVATGRVFTSPKLTRNNDPVTMADFIAGCRENHCLDVVVGEYPTVSAALGSLNKYASAQLTGTGACVFAPFESECEAIAAMRCLETSWSGFVARGMNRSPLFHDL